MPTLKFANKVNNVYKRHITSSHSCCQCASDVAKYRHTGLMSSWVCVIPGGLTNTQRALCSWKGV